MPAELIVVDKACHAYPVPNCFATSTSCWTRQSCSQTSPADWWSRRIGRRSNAT